jgi:formate dehydrogenase major subunit
MLKLPRLTSWPALRQLLDRDGLGVGRSVQSEASRTLTARIDGDVSVTHSICPYCAVGCAQLVYAKDGDVVQIEGDPASPISRGRLCPKGSASFGYVKSPLRETKVKYRRPYGTEWEELPLDDAMEMIADRVIATRRDTWAATDDDGNATRRTLGIANLGGATLDNEENYLIKKLMTGLGVVQVENQARI